MSALVWVLAAAALAGVAAVVASARRSARRIDRLRTGVAELSEGNFGHRILLDGSDRLALLADDLNGLAEAMQRERESSARREAARRRVVEDVSHDLRTPITSIAGYVDALRRGLGDDPDRYLTILADKADELAQLTDDLFYATRIDSGDLKLARHPVDLAELVRRTVLGFEPQLAAGAVAVGLDIPDHRCVTEGDESALQRTLANVVSNSIRHAEGMSRFEVRLADAEGSWRLTVTNDGADLTIPPAELFRRGSAGVGGGTGLGLAIARELTERLGGRISVSRPPRGGVAFELMLPQSAEAVPAEEFRAS